MINQPKTMLVSSVSWDVDFNQLAAFIRYWGGFIVDGIKRRYN